MNRDDKIKNILENEFKGVSLEEAFLSVRRSRNILRANAEKVEPYKEELAKLKEQMEPTKQALEKLTAEKSKWMRKHKKLKQFKDY